MVDHTAYSNIDTTPELAVRNIFGRQRAPAKLCLLFAGCGLLTSDRISQLGQDPASVRKTFSLIIDGDDKLGAHLFEQECNWLTVLAICQSCKKLVSAAASRHAKIFEDPTNCPALPHDVHVDSRARFILAHADMIMIERRGPHKMFVERISRDVVLHGAVPFYKADEMWLRSDTIDRRAGLAPHADYLAKVSQIGETIVTIRSEEEFMDRLHAFFVALEYLAICEFSVKDGPITYIQELQAFRRKTPDFACLFRADKFFRKKIARLTIDDRCTFISFSQTLLYVLQHCQSLWIRALRPELRRKFYAAGSAPSIPSGKGKRLIGAVHEDPPSSKSGKLAPIRRAAQAMKRSAFRGRVQRDQALVAPGKWVPEKEWSQLSFVNVPIQAARRCKFFNTSVGCRVQNCKRMHLCFLCGGAHPWADVHFK